MGGEGDESGSEKSSIYSSLPKSFTTITPLSKFVSLVLFITLPFIGFYLGYGYGLSTNPRNSNTALTIKTVPSTTKVVQPTQPIIQNAPTGSVKTSNCIKDLGANPYVEKEYGNTYSESKGWCKLTIPFTTNTGYSLEYPENWVAKVVGVTAQNIVFNEREDKNGVSQDLFVNILSTKLALKDTYKEVFQWEGSVNPVVESNEVIKSKLVKNIGNKECLVLVTSMDNKIIKRYFTILKKANLNNLFVFQIKTDEPEISNEKAKVITNDTEEMLKSLNLY